jgi:hypothetical protein
VRLRHLYGILLVLTVMWTFLSPRVGTEDYVHRGYKWSFNGLPYEYSEYVYHDEELVEEVWSNTHQWGNPEPMAATTWSAGDFVISLSPTSVELGRRSGTEKTVSVALLSVGQFASPVTLSISGLPAGVSVIWEATVVDMAPGRFSSTSFTLKCGPSAVDGRYTATVTAEGRGITHTAQLGIVISETAPPDQYHGGLTSYLSIKASPSTVEPGGRVKLSGRLTGPSGEGVSGRSITLNSDFWMQTVSTDQSGGFSTTLTAPEGEGSYIIRATFQGDDLYSPSSISVILVVKAEGTTGIKTIYERLPGWAILLVVIFTLIIGMLILVAINKPELRPREVKPVVALPEGARLVKLCPSCGTENPLEAEYCLECGAKL